MAARTAFPLGLCSLLGVTTACGPSGSAGDAGQEREAAVMPADAEAASEDGGDPADASPDADAEGRDASGPDAGARADAGEAPSLCRQGEAAKLDLLFVVDDSGSMLEEQASLARALPRMVQILASGDRDDDGEQDFPPVKDMHVGVVSTNMGVLGNTVPAGITVCAGAGDDGLLQFDDACDGKSDEGNFLAFSADDDPALLATRMGCLVQSGNMGCGFEQPLEAMLKALSGDDASFAFDTTGHANDANAGFVREDAVLAVVVVSDEDDCSLPEENAAVISFLVTEDVTTLTDMQTGEPYELDLRTPLNLRCGSQVRALWPIDRYADGLLALKPEHPERVVFSAIAGIPVALESEMSSELLEHPELQFEAELTGEEYYDLVNTPRPACSRDHDDDPDTVLQEAYAPLRFLELAARFEPEGVVRSICQDEFDGSLDAIVDRVSAGLECVELN